MSKILSEILKIESTYFDSIQAFDQKRKNHFLLLKRECLDWKQNEEMFQTFIATLSVHVAIDVKIQSPVI